MLSRSTLPSKGRAVLLVSDDVQLSPLLLRAFKLDGHVELMHLPRHEFDAALGHVPIDGTGEGFDNAECDYAGPTNVVKLFGTAEDEKHAMTADDVRRLKIGVFIVALIVLAMVVAFSTGCSTGFSYETTLTQRVTYDSIITDTRASELRSIRLGVTTRPATVPTTLPTFPAKLLGPDRGYGR